MKCLKRNETTFYYALFDKVTRNTDTDGLYTGEESITYHEPVQMKANISDAMGYSDVKQFGIAEQYRKTIITDDMNCPIAEDTILWIDVVPDSQGTTKNDYMVERVSKSLNHITIEIKKVKKS